MRTYRRILAFIDISADHKAVADRAAQLSRHYGADVALASVVDLRPGFDCDHVPFLTPRQLQKATAADVGKRVEAVADAAGLPAAEIIVGSGGEADTAAEIANSWQPDLVLVGADAPHGFDAAAPEKRGGAYDVLIVQTGKPGFAGRLINALAAAF